jgi:hypothetical protein
MHIWESATCHLYMSVECVHDASSFVRAISLRICAWLLLSEMLLIQVCDVKGRNKGKGLASKI